jgi:cation:H+ antiporter
MTDSRRLVPFFLGSHRHSTRFVAAVLPSRTFPTSDCPDHGGRDSGAFFLLLWACDAAYKGVFQAPALAIVALIAVLPEYAVDLFHLVGRSASGM